jgi:hypothetical protein
VNAARSALCTLLCALALPAWAADYTCPDPRSEQIRQALGIRFDLDAGKRTLESCISREWPESSARLSGVWILGIVERRHPSEGGEHVFRLFVARQEGDGYRLQSSYGPFRVLWSEPPRWREGIVDLEVGALESPLVRPAFGVRFRAAHETKMEARWDERLVLFAIDTRLVPFFGTAIRTCDCRIEDEAYPIGCFEQRSCPGKQLSAELSVARSGRSFAITKRLLPAGPSLTYAWGRDAGGREGFRLDPLEPPLAPGVEERLGDARYD